MLGKYGVYVNKKLRKKYLFKKIIKMEMTDEELFAHATHSLDDLEISKSESKGVKTETENTFVNLVLDSEYLNEESKARFKKKFLKYYLRDENFRNDLKDHYILFINKKYVGICKDIDEVNSSGDEGDTSYCIKISNKKEYALAKFNVDANYFKDIMRNIYLMGNKYLTTYNIIRCEYTIINLEDKAKNLIHIKS